MGGFNNTIQADETAVCRGKIVVNLNSTQDTVAGATWLVGGIEDESDDCFPKVVPSRSTNIMMMLFNI